MRRASRSRRSPDHQLMLSLSLEIPYAHPAIPVPGWTEEEIQLLMEKMLMRELSTVANMGAGARASADRRAEAWEWILDDSTHPFSFRSCAAGVGVEDVIALRVSFARVVLRSETAHEGDRQRAGEMLKLYRGEESE